MNLVNYFKDVFESTPGYTNIIPLLFLIENDVDVSNESGFLENDNNRPCINFLKYWMTKRKITWITLK